MSDEHGPEQQPDPADDQPSGLNLTLAYSLLAVALVAAICIALFIVLPFYHRR
jgi:hypothetical protein